VLSRCRHSRPVPQIGTKMPVVESSSLPSESPSIRPPSGVNWFVADSSAVSSCVYYGGGTGRKQVRSDRREAKSASKVVGSRLAVDGGRVSRGVRLPELPGGMAARPVRATHASPVQKRTKRVAAGQAQDAGRATQDEIPRPRSAALRRRTAAERQKSNRRRSLRPSNASHPSIPLIVSLTGWLQNPSEAIST